MIENKDILNKYTFFLFSLECVSLNGEAKSDFGGRTGLVVRASDSGSGDPGLILGRVSVLFP